MLKTSAMHIALCLTIATHLDTTTRHSPIESFPSKRPHASKNRSFPVPLNFITPSIISRISSRTKCTRPDTTVSQFQFQILQREDHQMRRFVNK